MPLLLRTSLIVFCSCWHPTTAAGPSVALSLELGGKGDGTLSFSGVNIEAGYDHARFQGVGGYGAGGHIIVNPVLSTIGVNVRGRAALGGLMTALAPELVWSFRKHRLIPGLFAGFGITSLAFDAEARCTAEFGCQRPEYVPDLVGELGLVLGFTAETWTSGSSKPPPIVRGPRIELQLTKGALD